VTKREAVACLVAAGAPEDEAAREVEAMAQGAIHVAHGLRVARGLGWQSRQFFVADEALFRQAARFSDPGELAL
jgi:hypothetical protein